MKRSDMYLRFFLVLILLCVGICGTLVSCTGTEDLPEDAVTSAPEHDTVQSETSEDLSEVTTEQEELPVSAILGDLYRVISSDLAVVVPDAKSADERMLMISGAICKAIQQKTGVYPQVKSDWVKKTDEIDENACEILIGNTNRAASTEALHGLGDRAYVVTVIGKKIVLNATVDTCLDAAMEAFLALLDAESVFDGGFTLKLPLSVTEELSLPTIEEIVLSERTYKAMNYDDMKCLWLSQFDLASVYSASGKQRSEADYRKYLTVVLDNTVALGINTVIVQMRPNADSMYPSEYYPPSTYVVGAYGKDFSYDPMEILIALAHERNLSVQAWINPLRGMTTEEILKIDPAYPIRKWYDDAGTRGTYLVTVSGRVYLNPAYPAVRQLILNGAAEILMRYDVDGLHMDDYFYPTTDVSFDKAAFEEYRASCGTLDLANFRRDCLNQLVAGLYRATKAVDEKALFGISPAGNWNNVYDSHYADVYTWCGSRGYLDYICPQVYFGMEHASYGFVKTAQKWQSMITNDSGVKLIIGMTLGKAKSGSDSYAGSGKNEWTEHKDVLLRCLAYTKELKECVGVAYFCYQYFYHPTNGTSVPETEAERNNFLPLLREITWQDGAVTP